MTPEEWCKYHSEKIKAARLKMREAKKLERERKRKEYAKSRIENLDDSYVLDQLRNQLKADRDSIPKEFIEIKRTLIKIRRLKKKRTEAIKICPVHGPLSLKDVNIDKAKKNIRYRCKQCQKEAHKKHYERHKDKVLGKHKEYREQNPEKVRETKRVSNLKNRHKYIESRKIREKEYRKKFKEKLATQSIIRKQRQRDELYDSYVKQRIKKKYRISTNEIPPSMIETERAFLKLYRQIQKSKNEEIINEPRY